jgi:CheY-like chemotaxis protein
VVTNLVLNGTEAIVDGVRGTVTLDASVEAVDVRGTLSLRSAAAPRAGKYVVLSVSDTGAGGVGTTFRVYWPLADVSSNAATSQGPTAHVDLGATTVLLVDDEPAVREVTAPLLEELDCTVHRAASGCEALALLEREHARIDVVLLDLTMPEQTGLEVLEALRQVDPEVCAVLTSGYGIENAGETFLPPGAVGFVPKPHDLANLESALRRALESKRGANARQAVSERSNAEDATLARHDVAAPLPP